MNKTLLIATSEYLRRVRSVWFAIATLAVPLLSLAVFALPAFVGFAAGAWAHGTGAGIPGAILVGLLEAFSSFWASAYKEVIVFTLIIPVLVWRSLTSHHVEEDE